MQSSVLAETEQTIRTALWRLEMRSISALLMNSNAALLGGGKSDEQTRDPAGYEREHYRDKAYVDPSGQLIIPARAIHKSLIDACRFYPAKPKGGTNFKSFGPLVQAATIVVGDGVLGGATLDALIPYTAVVSLDPSKGNKGPRGPRTRPMLPVPWVATAELMSFDPILTPRVLQDLCERAGKQVGLLDGRAIGFGRCLITLTEVDAPKAR